MPKYLANFPLPLNLHLLYIDSKISFSSLSLLLTVHNSIPKKIVSFFAVDVMPNYPANVSS